MSLKSNYLSHFFMQCSVFCGCFSILSNFLIHIRKLKYYCALLVSIHCIYCFSNNCLRSCYSLKLCGLVLRSIRMVVENLCIRGKYRLRLVCNFDLPSYCRFKSKTCNNSYSLLNDLTNNLCLWSSCCRYCCDNSNFHIQHENLLQNKVRLTRQENKKTHKTYRLLKS